MKTKKILTLVGIFFFLDNGSVKCNVWNDLGLPTALPNVLSNFVGRQQNRSVETKHSSNQVNTVSSDSLRFVYVLARHGSRSPLFSYPTDPYPFTDDRYWPDGPGYLTAYGKRQEYAVGKRLRARYAGFLSANYSPNETKIVSNESPRDFESAACIAAGLYPPVGYQQWNPALKWNPIPIQYEPFDVIDILNPGNCPKFVQDAEARVKTLDGQSNKYRKVIDYIARYSGIKNPVISQVGRIYDALVMQDQNGLKLPDWTKPIYPQQLEFFYNLVFNAYFVGSEQATKLTGGRPLMNIWENLRDKARGDLVPNLRMYILTAHDTTIRAVLSALDIDKPFNIETSAYLLVELHENSAGNFVQLLYVNNSDSASADVYDIPLCSSSPCPLADFGQFALSKQLPSLTEACRPPSIPEIDYSNIQFYNINFQ